MSKPRMRCPHCGKVDWTRAPELHDTMAFIASRKAETTSSDIVRRFGVSIQSASNRIRTLSDFEFIAVRRTKHPSGGIQQLVQATAHGRAALAPSQEAREGGQ